MSTGAVHFGESPRPTRRRRGSSQDSAGSGQDPGVVGLGYHSRSEPGVPGSHLDSHHRRRHAQRASSRSRTPLRRTSRVRPSRRRAPAPASDRRLRQTPGYPGTTRTGRGRGRGRGGSRL